MNFIFISPNFPESYYLFCEGLKNNGVNVLGIGDAPFNDLNPRLQQALTEYFKVASLENYDEVMRAVAYLTYKHGKIDWIESNNEYWLRQDARLRKDFNVTNGFTYEHITNIQSKSKMKQYYHQAGVATARYEMATTFEAALDFVEKVGYPIVIKPDVGVGSSDTFKIKNEEDLKNCFEKEFSCEMIMEEYIDGESFSFDGLTNSHKEIMFMTSHLYTGSIMDSVNDKITIGCYSAIDIPEDVISAGTRCVDAFDAKNRFFHFEFFRLNRDHEGVGKKGDVIGLEVNMRPPGGFLPDMINYANNSNVYQLWADMITNDNIDYHQVREYSSGFIGRRDENDYVYSAQQIKEMYADAFLMSQRLPKALAEGMGDEVIMARFRSEQEILDFFEVCAKTK